MLIKLISLNIEGDNHLELVKSFVKGEQAEVVCLQEVMEERVGELLREYPYREFYPNVMYPPEKMMGVVVGSKLPMRLVRKFYADELPESEIPINATGVHRPAVVVVEVEKGREKYQLGTTHFTWTPGGSVTEKQNRHLEKLMSELAGNELVLAGDFNMPRGNAAYEMVAKKWKDNIPQKVETTLDPKLHRAKKEQGVSLKYVVDYVWSTAGYRIGEVEVKCGVSDHCGLKCEIMRASSFAQKKGESHERTQ